MGSFVLPSAARERGGGFRRPPPRGGDQNRRWGGGRDTDPSGGRGFVPPQTDTGMVSGRTLGGSVNQPPVKQVGGWGGGPVSLPPNNPLPPNVPPIVRPPGPGTGLQPPPPDPTSGLAQVGGTLAGGVQGGTVGGSLGMPAPPPNIAAQGGTVGGALGMPPNTLGSMVQPGGNMAPGSVTPGAPPQAPPGRGNIEEQRRRLGAAGQTGAGRGWGGMIGG